MKIFGYDVKVGKDVQKKSFGGKILSNITNQVSINNDVFFSLYKRNPDIRQAINKISQAVARNGLIVYNQKGEVVDKKEIDRQVESYFEAPTFLQFKRELFKQYMISGELYVTNMTNVAWRTVGYQILDSRTMTKTFNREWELVWFIQYNSKGQTKKFTRDEVAFYKYEDSVDNANNGMSILEGIVWDGLADIKWSEKNYYLIDNDSMPGGIIMLNENMSIDEQKNAVDQFRAQHKWADNTNRMMVAGWVKDIKSLYINNKDMEWINQRKLTTEKISAATWVPKNILWYVDSVNLANGKEMREEYLQGTIRPLENDFEYILNSLLLKFAPEIAKSYTVVADGETLQDEEAIEARQRQDISLGIRTIDEVREDRGLDTFDSEQSSNPIITNNYVMLEDIIMDQAVNLNEL